MDGDSDSDLSDKANRDFGYDVWRGGNSDHTSEEDAKYRVSHGGLLAIWSALLVSDLSNEIIRKQDKKFQAKVFRQFKKGRTQEEVLNVLSAKGHVEAVERIDRVCGKLQHGVAVWDAPNVKATKLKLLDSRYSLLFKYEWGMQLSLLDNFHGQEKAFDVDSAFSDNHHLEHCRVEAISPNLLLFFRTHGWARCFELYFLQLDSDNMKCKLLFHKRIRYGFQDIFFDSENRRSFVISAFDYDEKQNTLWIGCVEEGAKKPKLITVEPLVYAIQGAEKNSHKSEVRISEKFKPKSLNHKKFGTKNFSHKWEIRISEKRIYERFYCIDPNPIKISQAPLFARLDGDKLQFLSTAKTNAEFVEFRLVPGQINPPFVKLFDIETECKFDELTIRSSNWSGNVGCLASDTFSDSNCAVLILDLNERRLSNFKFSTLRQSCMIQDAFVDDAGILTLCVNEHADGTFVVYRFTLNQPDTLANLAYFKIRRDSMFFDSKMYKKLLPKLPANLKPFHPYFKCS